MSSTNTALQKECQCELCFTELSQACQKRDLSVMDEALKKAKEVNFDNQLDVQIAISSRLRENVSRLEKLRHAVLNMDQKTVAELKSYTNPPAGVHQSMMAIFLLLGSPLKELKVKDSMFLYTNISFKRLTTVVV